MTNEKALVVFFSRAGENFFPGGTRVIEKGNTHVAAEIIAEKTNAEVVQVIGSKFVLYRPKKKDPVIVLPKVRK